MIALDNQPFTIIEDLGFKRLMKKFKPNYVLPSRKFFTNKVLPSVHSTIMDKVLLLIYRQILQMKLL